ncbi:peptidoglycan editing factor PgeF [Prochlorococcus sp. AH-716-O05]|nr:peptidoglycan editing factor PgeF [Prochlorococcus sp. AH-716-O05]
MSFSQKYFQENEFAIKDKKLKYYLSPTLLENNFKHGFFNKTSSEINLSLLSNRLKLNDKDCVLSQIHSNQIVFGSKTQEKERVEADGIVSDKQNQNLWIYTADCMPILFADKKKRLVAAIHCGRKGLENKIIKKLIKIFYDKGCLKEDMLVAIGPSISQKKYLIDNKTFQDFHKKAAFKESISCSDSMDISLNLKEVLKSQKKDLMELNLKKYAQIELLKENIPNTNIDISNLCTYESNQNFHSWRRTKTYLRQWSFISS